MNFLVITFKPMDRLVPNLECGKICMVGGLFANAVKPLGVDSRRQESESGAFLKMVSLAGKEVMGMKLEEEMQRKNSHWLDEEGPAGL